MSRHVAVSRAVMTIGVAGAFAGLAWADAVGLAGAAPAWWLVPVVLIVAIVGSDEFVRLCGARELRLPAGLMRTATVAVPLAALVGSQAASAASPTAPLGWSAVALALAIGAFFTREIAGYRPGNGGLERLAAATLLTAYLGLPLACMIGLRLSCTGALGADRTGSDPVGIMPLVSLIAVVKAADVAAYVVGTLFGRRRLAPVLSPGKTRVGAVAALAGALGAAWLVLEGAGFEAVARPWGGWAVYGLALGIAGMLGDLAESLLKREAAAKDSGRMLGGLGGVLDLVDSLLFAAPVAWLLWMLGR